MGLFGRDKDKQAFGYRRPRAETLPEGWIETQALVDTCEAEKTNTRIGTAKWSNEVARVYRTRATYLVLDQHGAPLPIVVEAKLHGGEVPQQGSRLMVAYDPSDPTHIRVLLSEIEHAKHTEDYVRMAVETGVEAPCEIVAAEPTGRVSRPKALQPRRGPAGPVPDPARELHLNLRVTPSGAVPFDVRRSLWDRDLHLAPGVAGTLFYLPDAPAQGYPVFPRERHRVPGGDPVLAARDEFVSGFVGQTTVMGGGLTITRGPAPRRLRLV